MDLGSGVGVESPVLDVADNAHNLTFHRDQFQVNVLTNGVLARERLAREFLVDSDGAGSGFIVLWADEAASDERNAHDFDVVGIDTVEQGQVHLARVSGLGSAFDPIRQLGITLHRRAAEIYAHGLNAGDGADLIQSMGEAAANSGGRAVYGGRTGNAELENVAGIESGIDAPQPRHRPDHQARGNGEHQRQRDFGNHQHTLEAMTRSVAAGGFLQRFVQFGADALQGGRDAEQQAGENRNER